MPSDPTSPVPRTAAVIINPAARGAVTVDGLREAARGLEARGWALTIEEADSAASTRTLAAEHARRQVDAILMCGGDGGLLHVLNGLRDAGPTSAAVGIIPAGTGNVWAREARIPRDPAGALGLLETGARRRVDLGVLRLGADGPPTRYLLVCGVGLDAAIVGAVERRTRIKRILGRVAFGLPALVAGVTWPAAPTRVEVDSDERPHPQMLMTLIANTRRYGGVVPIAEAARADSGSLEVVTFDDATNARLLHRAALVLESVRGGLDHRPVDGIAYRRGECVVVTPTRTLPVQADGDVIGTCGPDAPLFVDVEPNAVTMIVGRGHNPLWDAAPRPSGR